ncbi:MAG: hypothetical protein EG826_02850 [Deltaproteobacteria bacterium]|nr:hypothetical protein [Deltaproteobacteria bacterium]
MAEKFSAMMLETDEGLLNDIIIEFEAIDDTLEKAIARYDYPYADGVDLEDMGEKAHVIRFRCWFWDEGAHQTYDMHTLLLSSLETKELLDFVHPKYGLMKGKIESVAINHSDAVRAVSLDVTFIEQMRKALTVDLAQSVLSETEEAYQDAQAQQQSLLTLALGGILPASDIAALGDTLAAAEGILEQMEGYTSSTRAAVAAIEKHIATAEAAVSAVESPVNSLQATIQYSLNLPGRILGRISGAVEKLARLSDSLWNYPSQFIANLDNAMTDMQESFADLADSASAPSARAAGAVMSDHLALACAQRLALEAAAIYAADNDAATGESDPDYQMMTINELESTLAVVRTRLAAAVEIARDMDTLKIISAALLMQVNSVRLEREKMISVVLDNPLPLHLVCLKYGLPYTDAERLIRVNRISRPNYTDGEVAVYAR